MPKTKRTGKRRLTTEELKDKCKRRADDPLAIARASSRAARKELQDHTTKAVARVLAVADGDLGCDLHDRMRAAARACDVVFADASSDVAETVVPHVTAVLPPLVAAVERLGDSDDATAVKRSLEALRVAVGAASDERSLRAVRDAAQDVSTALFLFLRPRALAYFHLAAVMHKQADEVWQLLRKSLAMATNITGPLEPFLEEDWLGLAPDSVLREVARTAARDTNFADEGLWDEATSELCEFLECCANPEAIFCALQEHARKEAAEQGLCTDTAANLFNLVSCYVGSYTHDERVNFVDEFHGRLEQIARGSL